MPVTVTGTWIALSEKAGPDTIGTITQPQPTPQPAGPTIPPAPLGDGRGEVPGGDLEAKKNAVELAAARRGVGRQTRLKPAETNAKTAERMRTVRDISFGAA